MEQLRDPTVSTNAQDNDPGLHGLGLTTDTSPRSSNSSRSLQPLAPTTMPSVAPLRPQRRPLQDHLRRVESLDDSLGVPARSDSLKNRKSRRIRTASLDSPLLDVSKEGRTESNNNSLAFAPRDLDIFPHGYTPQLPFTFDKAIDDRISRIPPALQFNLQKEQQRLPNSSNRPQLDRSNTSYHTAQNNFSDYGDQSSPSKSSHSTSSSVSQHVYNRSSPLRTQFDGHGHSRSRGSSGSFELSNLGIQRKPVANQAASSAREWPRQAQSDSGTHGSNLQILESIRSSKSLSTSDATNLYTGSAAGGRGSDYKMMTALGLQVEESDLHILLEELRDELRAVGVELAASIQREMDLEDEVDRLKTEMPISRDETNCRTSDYYSDSAGSSIRFPLGESETKIQGLEKMRRKAEQEKAQMRHSMAQKLQEDLIRRKTLELHCQTLEERLDSRQSLESNTDSIKLKAKELEASLNDTRRRLDEERQVKQSIEDLLKSLRDDAETQRNERDNLRDEVLPQLRSRVEGLELEAAETQKLAYDNSQMQQEIQALRTENQTLSNARKMQIDLQNSRNKQGSDDFVPPKSPMIGISRSGSLAGSRSSRSKRFSISSGHDLSETTVAESTPESLKDVEDQRDALHRTLKSLIYRQNYMSQQYAKQIRALESERDKALNNSPRRKPFDVEVQELRSEVEGLRRRADDAMEQKWQCEKGLSGLKLDLDRAEQETVSLSTLVHEQENAQQSASNIVATNSLEKAYEELRQAHADSLLSLLAQPDAQAEASKGTESRMVQLSSEIEAQLLRDAELRHNLIAAIEVRVQEQQASAGKIEEMQIALKAAEDMVMDAQGASEETLAQQEEFVKDLKEMKRQMTRRGIVRNEYSGPHEAFSGAAWPEQSPRVPQSEWMSPNLNNSASRTEKSPKIPQSGWMPPNTMNGARWTAKSPKVVQSEWKPALTRKTTGMMDPGRNEVLEKQVRSLEEEAGRAEREIRKIVERMSSAQMEVAELQSESDEAMKQTRRLQIAILEERGRLKTISG